MHVFLTGTDTRMSAGEPTASAVDILGEKRIRQCLLCGHYPHDRRTAACVSLLRITMSKTSEPLAERTVPAFDFRLRTLPFSGAPSSGAGLLVAPDSRVNGIFANPSHLRPGELSPTRTPIWRACKGKRSRWRRGSFSIAGRLGNLGDHSGHGKPNPRKFHPRERFQSPATSAGLSQAYPWARAPGRYGAVQTP